MRKSIEVDGRNDHRALIEGVVPPIDLAHSADDDALGVDLTLTRYHGVAEAHLDVLADIFHANMLPGSGHNPPRARSAQIGRHVARGIDHEEDVSVMRSSIDDMSDETVAVDDHGIAANAVAPPTVDRDFAP